MYHHHETTVYTAAGTQESSFEDFLQKADEYVASFCTGNKFIDLIDEGNLQIGQLHKLLNTLFHQVYASSTSFALAGANVDSRLGAVRKFLFQRAEEEEQQWDLVAQNLLSTGFEGGDPREYFPEIPTQAFISFGMHMAQQHPVARLAMAYVLESLSGRLGIEYGWKAARLLRLNKKQMSFFLLNGELGQGRATEILNIMESAPLTPYEWAWCQYTAQCTVEMYRAMFNHAAQVV